MTLYRELQSLTLKVLSFISDGEEKFGAMKIIQSSMSSEKGGAMQCYVKKGENGLCSGAGVFQFDFI